MCCWWTSVQAASFGWEQCSHGLTSRLLESCHHQCLKAICYPANSGAHGWVSTAPFLLFMGVWLAPYGASRIWCGHATADLLD